MNNSLRVKVGAGVAAALFFIFGFTAVHAATYNVVNFGDSGTGTLRQAIIDANSTLANDTIVVSVCFCTITLTGGQLTISDAATAGSLTIIGPGPSQLRVSGSSPSRVFNIQFGAVVTMSGLTVSGGNITSGDGGGIRNAGTLTLTNVIVTGNSTSFAGGGIYNSGTLSITDSTISNNSALQGGAGILNVGNLTLLRATVSGNFSSGGPGGAVLNAGSLTVTDSTFSSNQAVNGGGIFNDSGTSTITGSTMNNNTAATYGGGIYNEATLALTNSTISGNTAGTAGGGITNVDSAAQLTHVTISGNGTSGTGGGVYTASGTVTLNSTIVANSAGGDCTTAGGTTSATYSLVEGGLGCVNGTNTSNIAGVDPQLGALAFNGGPTQTHSLGIASPARDAANSTLTVDQRGAIRPTDGDGDGVAERDIGSYEAAAVPTAADASVAGRVTAADGTGLPNVRVTVQRLSTGETLSVTTSFFGFFRVEGLESSEMYRISVSNGKRYRFASTEQVIMLNDSLTNINFTAAGR